MSANKQDDFEIAKAWIEDEGYSVKEACRVAKISKRTYYRYKNKYLIFLEKEAFERALVENSMELNVTYRHIIIWVLISMFEFCIIIALLWVIFS